MLKCAGMNVLAFILHSNGALLALKFSDLLKWAISIQWIKSGYIQAASYRVNIISIADSAPNGRFKVN